MKKAEVAFLLSVFGMAGVFSLMSIEKAVSLYPARHGPDAPAVGVGGEARDVDMERLRQLQRQGFLSDHEAEFYSDFTAPPDPTEETSAADEASDEKPPND